ncbi:MAG: LysR family hydrogen peroxide-inducible transcriptional activator [Flavobacteriales bacterium]|jgi:LysR family hydrogen peroxide-inducible transcriptional activator
MTLKQLQYAVAIDNFRSFTKAAASCLVTQPTLTMQVQKLEDEIGIKLFDRGQKPLVPTPTGEHFILRARQITREMDQLKEFVSSDKESISGSFSIGVIPTVAPYLLPLVLPDFIERYPDTHLVLEELQTAEIIRRLSAGTLDVGVLVTPLEERQIREIPLYNEPFLLYGNPKDSIMSHGLIVASELDSSRALLLNEGHCFREQTLNICGQSTAPHKGFEYASGSLEGLKSLVRRGLGYTLVPELSVNEEVESDYLRRFDSPEPMREVSLAVHSGFSKEALIEILRDSIQAVIPEAFQQPQHYRRIRWRL